MQLVINTFGASLFPMCRDDYVKVRAVGLEFDKKVVAGKVLTQVI